MDLLKQLFDWIFMLYAAAIIARTILTMLRMDPYHPMMNFLIQITEPLLAPLRSRIRLIGMWDIITPMAALFLLWAVHLIIIKAIEIAAVVLGAR